MRRTTLAIAVSIVLGGFATLTATPAHAAGVERLNCQIVELKEVVVNTPFGAIPVESRRYWCVDAAAADHNVPTVSLTARTVPVPAGAEGLCSSRFLQAWTGFPYTELTCTWPDDRPLAEVETPETDFQCVSEGRVPTVGYMSQLHCITWFHVYLDDGVGTSD